jgi:hypothetical protein
LVGLDREAIIQELRTAMTEALVELRPIEAEEVTDRDIIRLPDEHDGQEEDLIAGP